MQAHNDSMTTAVGANEMTHSTSLQEPEANASHLADRSKEGAVDIHRPLTTAVDLTPEDRDTAAGASRDPANEITAGEAVEHQQQELPQEAILQREPQSEQHANQSTSSHWLSAEPSSTALVSAEIKTEVRPSATDADDENQPPASPSRSTDTDTSTSIAGVPNSALLDSIDYTGTTDTGSSAALQQPQANDGSEIDLMKALKAGLPAQRSWNSDVDTSARTDSDVAELQLLQEAWQPAQTSLNTEVGFSAHQASDDAEVQQLQLAESLLERSLNSDVGSSAHQADDAAEVQQQQTAEPSLQHDQITEVGVNAHQDFSSAEVQQRPVQLSDSKDAQQAWCSSGPELESPTQEHLQQGQGGGSLEVNLGSGSLRLDSSIDAASTNDDMEPSSSIVVSSGPTPGGGLWRDVNSSIASSVSGEASEQGLRPDEYSDPVASCSDSSWSSSSANEALQLIPSLEGQPSAQSDVLVVDHTHEPSLTPVPPSLELLSVPPVQNSVTEVSIFCLLATKLMQTQFRRAITHLRHWGLSGCTVINTDAATCSQLSVHELCLHQTTEACAGRCICWEQCIECHVMCRYSLRSGQP